MMEKMMGKSYVQSRKEGSWFVWFFNQFCLAMAKLIPMAMAMTLLVPMAMAMGMAMVISR